MRKLTRNEAIAVIVSVAVIALIFFTGGGVQYLLTYFSPEDPLNREADNNMQKEDGTLTSRDLIVGQGAEAVEGSRVSIHYTGRFTDGTVFDSSVGRSPLVFNLGRGEVIQGLDM